MKVICKKDHEQPTKKGFAKYHKGIEYNLSKFDEALFEPKNKKAKSIKTEV